MHFTSERARFFTASLALAACLYAGSSSAQTLGPGLDLDSFRLIAIGNALEQKCQHLSAEDRERLMRYVSGAETAAVRTNGTSLVKGVHQEAQESKLSCGDATLGRVQAALSAGTKFENTASAYRQKLAGLDKRQQRTMQRKMQKEARKSSFFTVERAKKASHANVPAGPDLGPFEDQLGAYFINRNCKFLNDAETQRFWNLLMKRYSALSAQHEDAHLQDAKKRASASARQTKCTSRAWRTVEANLAALQTR